MNRSQTFPFHFPPLASTAISIERVTTNIKRALHNEERKSQLKKRMSIQTERSAPVIERPTPSIERASPPANHFSLSIDRSAISSRTIVACRQIWNVGFRRLGSNAGRCDSERQPTSGWTSFSACSLRRYATSLS